MAFWINYSKRCLQSHAVASRNPSLELVNSKLDFFFKVAWALSREGMTHI